MANAIIDTFDLWTTAQNLKTSNRGLSASNQSLLGIKKLRELILELAVSGKLVPQDPNDEPVSVLLKKIEKEKRQLIQEGKIKKKEHSFKVSGDEYPFDLPKSWRWTRIIDCFSIVSGTSFDKTKELDNGPYLYVKVADMNLDGNEVEITNSSRFYKPTNKELNALIPAGSIIFPKRGGAIATNKKRLIKRDLFVDLNIMAITPLKGISLDYAYRWLMGIDLERLNTGTSVPQINHKDIAPLFFPLPPLAEQHRIVSKVDELMVLCDQLEQEQTNNNEAHQTLIDTLLGTLTNAESHADFEEAWQRIANHFDTLLTTEHSIDQLKQTILQLAVMGKLVPQNPDDEPASELLKKIAKEKARLVKEGKIKKQKPLPEIEENEKLLNLPTSWGISRLGTFTVVGTGSTPSRDKGQYYFPQEFNWVSSGETNQDFIFDTDEKISSLALKETNVSIYPIGSLIIAMYGQGKTRGQVSELMIEAGTNQACAAIILINKEEAHRKYLKYFFKKAYEELRSHAAGGAQPNLNLGKVANTVIPLPPLAEQQRIVAKVDELFALCDALKELLRDAQALQNQLAVAVVEQAV